MIGFVICMCVMGFIVFLIVFFNGVFKRKIDALTNSLGKDLVLENETLVFGPVSGFYCGTNQHSFQLTGECVAVLTSRRFIYTTMMGRHGEILLSDIDGVSENIWFNKEYHNGREHMILELRNGHSNGFFLTDQSQMIANLKGMIKEPNG